MTTKAQRTETLIQHFRGNAHEFYMLKGVLCMDHGMDYADHKRLRALIDMQRIAERMDEMNNEARDAILNARKAA